MEEREQDDIDCNTTIVYASGLEGIEGKATPSETMSITRES